MGRILLLSLSLSLSLSQKRKWEGFSPTPSKERLARNSRLPGSLQECRRLRSTPSRMSWAPCAQRVGRIFLLVLSSQMKWICSFAKMGIALLGSPTEQNNEEKCGEDFATERSLSTGRVGGISFFLSGRRAVRMGSLHIKIGRAIPYTERMLRILHSSVK